jgi:uncharacterized protein YndB with AHSA1/START domain
MEEKNPSRPKFVYVTYINSTPEKVWNALTDPEMTKQYWVRHRNASDWKPGSPWQHQDYDDANVVDIVGKVIESAPPRRLVITWAFPADAANGAKHSRVTFQVEPFLSSVKLTVTHEELEPDSRMLQGITQGWPVVLSSLKTLLETGQALPWTTTREGWHERARA